MKVNWDFYIPKDEKVIDEQVIKSIEKNKEEILQENDIAIIEDFSSVKDNILNWYNFKENSKILEINTTLGGITRLLSKKAKQVVSTCENKSIAELLQKKYEQVDNIELYVGSLENIKLEENQFDYIIFYDLKEIYNLKKYLNETGIALLMVDNKFAITAFAGAKPKEGRIFETIMENDNKTFSKRQIEKTLKENDFSVYKFYYPLPNYRMPNVIFSDEYMPNENTTKLMYNICYRNGSSVVFDELKVLKQLTKDGQFDNFANSYLVEINNKEKNQPKFISFNNTRKPKYRLMTKIYDDYVEKSGCFEESKEHINNIEKNSINIQNLGFNIIDKKVGENICCRYMKSDTLDKILAKQILEGQLSNAYTLIEQWYEYIESKLIKNKEIKLNKNIQIDSDEMNELTIIQNGYIDIVFENTFMEDNQFILFDQEWYIEGIPLEFILYRAINNLYVYNQEINKIVSYQEMMNKFGLTQYLSIFKNIEAYVQSEIIDEKMNEVNQKSLNKLVDINLVSLMKTQINDYEENDKKKDEYIKVLENEIKKINEINKEQDEYIKCLEQKDGKNKIKKFWKGNK